MSSFLIIGMALLIVVLLIGVAGAKLGVGVRGMGVDVVVSIIILVFDSLDELNVIFDVELNGREGCIYRGVIRLLPPGKRVSI